MPSAIAWKMLVGHRLKSKSPKELWWVVDAISTILVNPVCSDAIFLIPTPGLKRLANPKPINKASVVTTSKYAIVLIPNLPRLLTSPCPAIPTTRVAKSNGAIIIFTILRNISAKTWSLTANAGKAHPTRTPNNSAAKIAIVNRDCFKIFSFSKPFNCKLYNKQEKSIQTCYDLLRILPAMIDTHICSS